MDINEIVSRLNSQASPEEYISNIFLPLLAQLLLFLLLNIQFHQIFRDLVFRHQLRPILQRLQRHQRGQGAGLAFAELVVDDVAVDQLVFLFYVVEVEGLGQVGCVLRAR